MTRNYDKPKYIDVKRTSAEDLEKKQKTKELVEKMLKTQAFGVLATTENDQSSTSLISFASSEDLTNLAFASPIGTKKVEMIEKNKKVSLLIDNRSENENSINDIAALTSLGEARVLKEKEEIEKWSEILINKHDYLDDFIHAETTALILVEIEKYYYVTSFQEVRVCSPE